MAYKFIILLVAAIIGGCATQGDNQVLSQAPHVDIIKRTNAGAPDWFTHPDQSGNVVYGIGINYEEALSKARASLANTIDSRITVTSDTSQKVTTDSSYTDYSQKITTSASAELSADCCTILHQEEMDGNWYIALTLRKNR